MDLGLGKKREQRQEQNVMDQEFQLDRDMSALQQAGQGIEPTISPDLVRWEHDLSDLNLKIILNLQRKERRIDSDGKVYYARAILKRRNKDGEIEKYHPKPILNEIGINAWKIYIAPMLSRNLLMSNFTEEQILNKLKNTTISWISNLALNQIEYGINKKDLPMLVRLFKSISEPSCWRSLLSGERNFLSTSTKRLEAISSSEQGGQLKKSALQKLMG